MFKIRADHAIAAFVDAMLKRPELAAPYKKGVHVVLDIRARHPENELPAECAFAHFLFTRPTNYTRVHFAVSDQAYGDPTWADVSYHDSCWRQDGFAPLTDLYFELATKLVPELRPRDMDYDIYVARVEYVEVDMQKLPKTEHGRDRYRPLLVA